MGKNDKTGVGRTVLKDRSKRARHGKGKESWLHTSELNDGEDWSRLNMQSVTEQSALDEFLATAELAGTEFIAEKLNVTVITANHRGGLPSAKEEERIQQVQDEHKQFLQIPRRPAWDKTTTPEQLEQYEKESFLQWRRALAELQEKDDIILTPFERNLEFWRQLWRVIERSDVIVQIVDARNPLLFRCEDLESYVNEVSQSKVSVLLINKADLLTQEQREAWANYFKTQNVQAVFWSAVVETERLKQLKALEESGDQETGLNEPELNLPEKSEGLLASAHVTKFLDLSDGTNLNEIEVKSLERIPEPLKTEGENTDFSASGLMGEESESHGLKISDSNAGVFDNKEYDVSNCSSGGCASGQSYPTESDPRKTYLRRGDSNKNEPMNSDRGNNYPSNSVPRNIHPMKSDLEGPDSARYSNISSDTLQKRNYANEDLLANSDLKFSEVRVSKGSETDVHSANNETDRTLTLSVGPLDKEDGKSVMRVAGKDVEFYTSGHLLTGEELLSYCQWLHQMNGEDENHGNKDGSCTVIGLVGYPNVGKSSTINAISQAKKVPVSATPGRTKHFQTLFVDKNICLCDCPGLVFPSFVTTKAEMVVSGILPIDQMRDHVAPVSLVCRRIPRSVLEAVYGINLVPPQEGEDPDREPYAEELLNAYGYSKGYMTTQGRPDGPRSARYILKDYVKGKLLFCHSPPTHETTAFQVSFTGDKRSVRQRPPTIHKTENKANMLDQSFFKQESPKFFTHATTGTEEYRRMMALSGQSSDSSVLLVGKPWKKHGNRNKREKIRRLQKKGF